MKRGSLFKAEKHPFWNLELVIRLAHLAILNERLVNEFGIKGDLTCFFKCTRPEKGFIKSLADGKAPMAAQHDDFVILQNISNFVRHFGRA